MTRLLTERQADEEIIVIDAASSDGSPDYLTQLLKEGHIDQFVSEPDSCQAEGANKGLLLARGEIIKIMTDDDASHYPGIRECKEYMMADA